MKWLRWPKTLASQLSLIFLVSLLLANGLSFSVQFYERYLSARSTMLNNMENDISTSVAILDAILDPNSCLHSILGCCLKE